MSNPQAFIERLLASKGIDLSGDHQTLLEAFQQDDEILDAVNSITDLQNAIMSNWKIRSRILEIQNASITIPNGTVKVSYKHLFDLQKLNLSDLINIQFDGLEEVGLTYDADTHHISGKPVQSIDKKIVMHFNIQAEEAITQLHQKAIHLVINPDPKSLWKNIPSDPESLYWKEDNAKAADSVGERSIVVASKRGRSHQNVGTARDDDFAYKHFEDSGWTIVAVSDGAGSAKLSRKGSQVACQEVVNHFEAHLSSEEFKAFEQKLVDFPHNKDEENLESAKIDAKKILYRATIHVNKKLNEIAQATLDANPDMVDESLQKSPINAFHSTLIFTLFKKFEIGYVMLNFSVGDCPIAVVNKDRNKVELLNWLDVGEFGGGTRFITQPEIFHSKERPMASRFSFHVSSDFSFLFLMTDGIYDPKFEVEANLEKSERWTEFIADLEGKNEDDTAVVFDRNNEDIAQQLSDWMDFWSKGNHDDRTLAIVF